MTRRNRDVVVELLFSPDSPFITVEISVPTEFPKKLKRKGIWLLAGGPVRPTDRGTSPVATRALRPTEGSL